MPIDAMAEAAVERAIGGAAETSLFRTELVVRASTTDLGERPAEPAGEAGAGEDTP
jgi:hypothetical protein